MSRIGLTARRVFTDMSILSLGRAEKSKFATASAVVAIAMGLATPRSWALPSFARQMNLQCIACHTDFPQLTDMGRQFKLSGYTMSAETSDLPPIAFMLQPS